MTVGALDETGQEKQGTATAGVKRQYMGCAGRVANGINTVHLSYVREKTGHALIGARQWIPEEQVKDPVKSLVTGLPPGLRFRTKGQLAIDVLAGRLRRRPVVRLRLRRRGLRQLHQLREHLEELIRRDGPVNGRHHVIIDTFDWPALQSYFQKLVTRCPGQDWHEIAAKLSRYGHWEFEDYAQAAGNADL